MSGLWSTKFWRTFDNPSTPGGKIDMHVIVVDGDETIALSLAVPHGDAETPKLIVDAVNKFRGIEPTHVAADGTVRQNHYGAGRQPWDDIRERMSAEAAAGFVAGNALKYVRRDAAIKGVDRDRDLRHARWYYARLIEAAADLGRAPRSPDERLVRRVLVDLLGILTSEELNQIEEK